MSILTVNNQSLPAPTSLHIALEDARLAVHTTLSGTAQVSRAAIKRRISVFWAHMLPADLQSLLTLVTQSPLFPLSFPDPLTGETCSISAYCTQRSVGLQRMQNGTPVWTNVEITFLES